MSMFDYIQLHTAQTQFYKSLNLFLAQSYLSMFALMNVEREKERKNGCANEKEWQMRKRLRKK